MPTSPRTSTAAHAHGRKGEAARERILDAARRLLIHEGYDALILRTVAARAGMKLGNLQYYFPTREALLEAVLRQEAHSDLAALQEASTDGAGPREALVLAVKLLAGKWRGESGKILALLGFLALHQPTFRALYREVYEQFYGELAVLVERVRPGLPRREYRRRARIITALLDGASMQASRGDSAELLRDVTEQAVMIAER